MNGGARDRGEEAILDRGYQSVRGGRWREREREMHLECRNKQNHEPGTWGTEGSGRVSLGGAKAQQADLYSRGLLASLRIQELWQVFRSEWQIRFVIGRNE